MNGELIRLKEISKNVGLSTSTLRKLIKKKEMKAVLLGGNYYVRPNDYYEFIYNIECKKLGVEPDIMKRFIENEQRKERDAMIEHLGLDQNSKDFLSVIFK